MTSNVYYAVEQYTYDKQTEVNLPVLCCPYITLTEEAVVHSSRMDNRFLFALCA